MGRDPLCSRTSTFQVFAVNSVCKSLAVSEKRDESKASKNFFLENLEYGGFNEMPPKRKRSIAR